MHSIKHRRMLPLNTWDRSDRTLFHNTVRDEVVNEDLRIPARSYGRFAVFYLYHFPLIAVKYAKVLPVFEYTTLASNIHNFYKLW